jgi:hypothetical protein
MGERKSGNLERSGDGKVTSCKLKVESFVTGRLPENLQPATCNFQRCVFCSCLDAQRRYLSRVVEPLILQL